MTWILLVGTFMTMEFIAWFTHKHIMHGPLWNLHVDHHIKENQHQVLEKNDYFFLIFATPGIFCLLGWSMLGIHWLLPIGLGITAYGLVYFLVPRRIYSPAHSMVPTCRQQVLSSHPKGPQGSSQTLDQGKRRKFRNAVGAPKILQERLTCHSTGG